MKKWHLWLAASIGLVVIAGMMIREFDVEALSRIDLSPRFFLGVVMGVLFFAVQNLMLTLRFRHLCQRKLSIAQGFRINVLCEFTSAVTPSAVGGSGLAFIYLNREGVSMGRSIFTMFAALLADEAFLAISCMLLYFCVPSHLLFSLADGVGISADATNEWIKGGVQVIFIISTLIVAVWTAILYLLLLHRPQILGWVLKGCCKIPFLRRFLPKVEKFSEEMTMASKEAKQEGGRFWLQLMGYTSLAWLSRFAIVVALRCLQPCWLMRLSLPSAVCCSISVFRLICFSVWQMEWGFLRMLQTNGLRAGCRLSSSSAPLSWRFGQPFSTSYYCIALRFWGGY